MELLLLQLEEAGSFGFVMLSVLLWLYLVRSGFFSPALDVKEDNIAGIQNPVILQALMHKQQFANINYSDLYSAFSPPL